MQPSFRKKLFDLLDSTYDADDSSRYFNVAMLALILLNVIAAIFETDATLNSSYKNIFDIFEAISIGLFTLEYIFRIWSCTEDPKYPNPISGRLRFMQTPSMLIDLAAILPFYVPLWGIDLRMIRVVRLFRLFRLMKMGRYIKSLSIIQNVIRSKKEELGITILAGMVLLVVASSLLYFVESDAQPDVFGSIPDAMWWGVVTLTTVGYGDVYPITTFGKIAGAIISVLGIGLFALPAGIIASGFASELSTKHIEKQICPHCGKEIA